MKGIFRIVLVAVAGFIGYKAEPSLRYQLTGIKATGTHTPASSPVPTPPVPTPPVPTPPVPTPPPAPTPPAPTPGSIDLASLTPAQLPAQITLKVAAEVSNASGLRLQVTVGSRIKPLRIEGTDVVISPDSGSLEGKVPISGTDLLEQLAQNPPTPVPTPDPVPTPEPAPVPPVAQTDPAPAGDSVEPADVTPPPAPAPTPAPTPAPAPAPADTLDVVALMKANIEAGSVKDIDFKQVIGWKKTEPETIDGQMYQTGLIAIKSETIFGVKTLEAKALIQNGKIVRWIWPKSGMEIK